MAPSGYSGLGMLMSGNKIQPSPLETSGPSLVSALDNLESVTVDYSQPEASSTIPVYHINSNLTSISEDHPQEVHVSIGSAGQQWENGGSRLSRVGSSPELLGEDEARTSSRASSLKLHSVASEKQVLQRYQSSTFLVFNSNMKN